MPNFVTICGSSGARPEKSSAIYAISYEMHYFMYRVNICGTDRARSCKMNKYIF